ncbi:MAG: 50S ribosomal protein L21e [archaeon]|nr:50S ribosomal protein L21e [archaeon]
MSSKKPKGKRAKTRDLFKSKGAKAKITVNKLLSEFLVGQTVTINIKGKVHDGIPFRRFQGLTGKIIEKRGRSYVVSLAAGEKQKQVIAGPAHLEPVK